MLSSFPVPGIAGLITTLALILSLAAVGCGAAATPTAAPAEPGVPSAQSVAPVQQSPQQSPQQPAQQAAEAAPAPAPVEATAKPAPAGASPRPTDTPLPAEAPPPATEASQPNPASVAIVVPEGSGSATPQLPEPGQVENVVFVVEEGSEATFTVNEKLSWLDLPNDAVMRTGALSGQVYLDGQPSVVDIDLHSLSSDSDRRDRYVRERMFPADPVATFTVTDLDQLPEPFTVGEVVAREVAGQLAIRGVTKPVTFAVEARLDSEKLFILGRTTFTWDELEIPPPNIPGRIQVKDEVRVEVLLSATPTLAGGS